VARARRQRVVAAGLVVLAVSCTSAGGSSPTSRAHTGIVIASFNFPESVVLAEIYGGALRSAGYRISVLHDVGPREVVDPALSRGLVDMVPEYSGSALLFFSLGAVSGTAESRPTHRALARATAPRGLVALSPAPAQDANAIVVTKDTAARYGLRATSDLAPVSSQLTFGGPEECPQRPLCLRGLRRIYGLDFKEFVPLDTGGPLTLQALVTGEIDVGLLFTTDPAIVSRHLVALRDDRGLQPAENVTPLIRHAVVARYGTRPAELIDRVSARLRTGDVRALDARVALGEDPSAIAAQWLAAQGMG